MLLIALREKIGIRRIRPALFAAILVTMVLAAGPSLGQMSASRARAVELSRPSCGKT
jgi:hypothetical protein